MGAGGDKPNKFSKTKTDDFQIPVISNGMENDGIYGFTDVSTIDEPSITISARGTIGYSKIRNEPYMPIVRLISVIPIDDVDIEYLNFVFEALLEKGEGTSTLQLTIPYLKEKLIPVPSHIIQIKIASLIKNVEALIYKIQSNSKEQSLLAESCKDKILETIFAENSSYKSYYGERKNMTLEALINKDKIGDGDWVLSENMDERGEYSLIQLKHIGKGCYQGYKSYNHVNNDFFISNNCSEIKENYLLINRLIADSMDVCITPKLGFRTITSVDVCWIAPDSAYNQKYLMYYLLSPSFQKEVLIKASGSTRKRISKKNLIKIPLFIHDRKIQDIIAEKIENAFKILETIIS
ncbi:MAG: restriction endonuclease subunit S [Bacilli bacterium]|nr:restriction endonuclease subunit S [Bacilli bacterium]